jgi:PadR family transcriptional regulator, regulatory protein PadR
MQRGAGSEAGPARVSGVPVNLGVYEYDVRCQSRRLLLTAKGTSFIFCSTATEDALRSGDPVAPRPPTDALRGSLDLLVLKTLSLAPMHGWGISQRVQQISDGVLEVNQGSLYPALQRLEKEGLITSDWGTTDNNRRARYYRLTASGRRVLGDEVESWRRFAAGLEAVLRTS